MNVVCHIRELDVKASIECHDASVHALPLWEGDVKQPEGFDEKMSVSYFMIMMENFADDHDTEIEFVENGTLELYEL